MSMKDKNDLLYEYINDLYLEVNKQYKGLMDKEKIKELYDKYKDSDKDLKKDIIPEIEDTINKLIDEYIKLKKDLEDMIDLKMKQESEKLSSLSNSEEAIANVEMINSMALGQLESKEDLKKYISDVCSKNPSLDSQVLMEKFDSIISDEQVEVIRNELVEKYRTNLNQKYGNIELGTPEEIRAKLASMGVDVTHIDEFVEKVAKGENVEAIAELVQKYGEKVVEQLQEDKKEEVGFEQIKKEVYTKKLVNPYYRDGKGYVAILVAIVAFGVGVISTVTYFIVASIFK